MTRAKAIPQFLYPLFALGIFLGLAAATISARAAAEAGGASAPGLEPYSSVSATCVADTENMLAYWPFDESEGATSFDDAIADRNGTCDGPGGFCPVAATGKLNNAFTFDGADDEVDVSNASIFSWSNTDSFSYEAWVKIPNGELCTGNKVVVARRGGSNVSTWLGCGKGETDAGTANRAVFSVRDSDNIKFDVTGTTAINDGAWHHLVGVRDAAAKEIRIYVDGTLNGTTSSAEFTGNFSSTQPLTIGYTTASPFYYFKGEIDELAVYNRALTPGEIQAHYYGGAGQSYCNEPPTVQHPGNQTHAVGDSVNLPITASDPDYEDTLAYSASGLPPYLTIDTTTGLISGTLASNALGGSPYTVTVTATDSKSLSGDATFNWTVTGENHAPDVDDPGDQEDHEGASVSLQIVAEDQDGNNLTYQATGLPGGLSIDEDTGLISGTIAAGAAASSPYDVTVTVTDDGTPPQSSEVSFKWVVTIDLSGAPQVTNPGDQTSKETESVSLQIVATDPNADPLTYGATGLPTGLTINTSTGLISGTLLRGSAGDYQVTVTVSDGQPGHQVTVQFKWTVTPLYHIYLPIVIK